MGESEGDVAMEIADDGVGFEPHLAVLGVAGHMGLAAMRERAEMSATRPSSASHRQKRRLEEDPRARRCETRGSGFLGRLKRSEAREGSEEKGKGGSGGVAG
jgi:hypothetical protein